VQTEGKLTLTLSDERGGSSNRYADLGVDMLDVMVSSLREMKSGSAIARVAAS